MIDKTEGEHNKTTGSAVGGADRFVGVLQKRRRFVTGGLAAAPILASLEVRNALAADCLTPSRNLSGNLSHTNDIGTCAGLSAQCFSTQAAQWPSGVTQTTLFNSVYILGPQAPNITSSSTLKQVVDKFSSPPNTVADQLGAYFVAAYLNARKGLLNNLGGMNQASTITMLQNIWSQWVSTGLYSVNATTSWTGADIKLYLTNNGIVGTVNC